MITVSKASRSGLPSPPLGILAGTILLWVVTVACNRGRSESGTGLVAWKPHEKVAAAARSEGKPVLYDFTAAWCAPCRLLDAQGWGDPGIASLVNRSYLPARVVDREREDGKNPPAIEELERRYSVDVFPTLVVAAPDGRLIAKLQGFVGRDKLLRFLQESIRKAP